MHVIRAYLRILFFSVTISLGILTCLVNSLFGGNALRRNMKIRRRWIFMVSRYLGLRINKTGHIPEEPCLLVSNHRSFIDPVVALHFAYAWPLAKAEISSYPMIGFGARITGILYVNREDGRSRMGAREKIRNTLTQGYSVLIYPEGTTGTAATTLEFKRGSFQVVANMDIPVVPVAIEYEDPLDHWGATSMFSHYRYQFGKATTRCSISFGPVMRSDDYQVLLKDSRKWIDDELLRLRKQFESQATH